MQACSDYFYNIMILGDGETIKTAVVCPWLLNDFYEIEFNLFYINLDGLSQKIFEIAAAHFFYHGS